MKEIFTCQWLSQDREKNVPSVGFPTSPHAVKAERKTAKPWRQKTRHLILSSFSSLSLSSPPLCEQCCWMFMSILYDLLNTIFGPSDGTVAFLYIATILWSLHPMGTDTALEQSSAEFVPVVFVNTLVGWLVTWSRLQALVTVRSFLLSGQLDDNESILRSVRM